MRTRTVDLGAKIAGLRGAVTALEAVDPALLADPGPLRSARQVLARIGERRALSAEHTVVALAGTTGSGKSSLLNAIAGIDIARVGARRPTTSHPLAVLWPGEVPTEEAGPLLDWLEVETRHELQVQPGQPQAPGLVLLDLPDIDSVEPEHRSRAERLAQAVDVLVWVVDPQKYADAVVHAEFLQPMARHAEVTLVVLNQIDTLGAADRSLVLEDLRSRLDDDGLGAATVLGVSARTSEGVEQVTRAIAGLVRKKRAAQARLAADIGTVADDLAAAYPVDGASELSRHQSRALVEALCGATGVEQVAQAVAGSYRLRAHRRTGWPPLRWLGRFRADPLRRLHLQPAAAGSSTRSPSSQEEPVVTTSSGLAASPVQQAQVSTALRAVADAAAPSGPPWRTHVRSVVAEVATSLTDDLDQVLVRTPLPGYRDPRWFAGVGALQWLVLGILLLGAAWLGVYAVMGYLRLEVTWVPQIGPVPANPPLPALPAIPWPTVLLVGGAIAGIVVALLSRLLARAGARRHRRRTRTVLRRQIADLASDRVLAPLRARQGDLVRFRQAIVLARGK